MYIPQRLIFQEEVTYIANDWMTLKEPIGLWGNNNFTSRSIMEHLNVTKDKSDYLWYTTRYGTVIIKKKFSPQLWALQFSLILQSSSVRPCSSHFKNIRQIYLEQR